MYNVSYHLTTYENGVPVARSKQLEQVAAADEVAAFEEIYNEIYYMFTPHFEFDTTWNDDAIFKKDGEIKYLANRFKVEKSS